VPESYVIGVDLGGTKLLAAAVGRDLSVHHRALRPSAGLPQGELLDMCVEAVEEARAEAPGEVEGVGFGIPCLIDQEKGMALMAVNLEIVDVRFRDLMAERLGLPVWVDNDGNVAALAEHRFGAARGTSEALLLTIGTGIGGGLILGGRPYRGATGAGAEIGHIVVDMDGPRCQGNCPNRGCLEAVASGTAIATLARKVAGERPESALGKALAEGTDVTGSLATELAHDGDEAAISVLAEIGRRLGAGISGLVNLFEPEVVVVGGGAIAAGDLLLEPARREMAARALPPLVSHTKIVPARFKAEAGMLGAAALAWDGLAQLEAAQ
jgi:glucokinase